MNTKRYQACHCCGLIHVIPPRLTRAAPTNKRHKNAAIYAAYCVRCESEIYRLGSASHSAKRTAAAAIGAIALFGPAIFLPLLEIERFGHFHKASLIEGVFDLLRDGHWFVGLIVLFFSVIFPFVKLVLLMELSVAQLLHQKHRAWTHRLVEHLGKWSMLDVLLLAFLVMLIKLGDLVTFHFGPAVTAFVLCVAMSMLASLSFDPHSIWTDAVAEQAVVGEEQAM